MDCFNWVVVCLPFCEYVVEILIVWADVEIARPELGLVVLRKGGDFGDIDDVLILSLREEE